MGLTFDAPIIVNVRDRVTPLRQLVEWLERAGHERIVLLDNASTYEPLLAYLEVSPHHVIMLPENCGARAFWTSGAHDAHGWDWFVYTDPDCVPIEDCPLDAVSYLHELLERYPDAPKAGLGLYLADVPASMPHYQWEAKTLLESEPNGRWKGQLEPGVYDSWIDTTFALYRPGSGYGLPALRTGFPYQCRHLSPSWYPEVPLSAENAYYLQHAKPGPLYSGWKGSYGR